MMPHIESIEEDDREKVRKRRTGSTKEWEFKFCDRIDYKKDGVDYRLVEYEALEEGEREELKDHLITQFTEMYDRPVEDRLTKMDGEDAWSLQTFVVKDGEDAITAIVGTWGDLFQVVVPEGDGFTRDEAEGITYVLLDYADKDSFGLKAPTGRGIIDLIEFMEEELWKVENVRSLEDDEEYPSSGALHRVIGHRPIGLEILCYGGVYGDDGEVATELQEAVSALVGDVEVFYTSQQRVTSFVFPFKPQYTGKEEYYSPVFGELDKYAEMIQTIGNVLEEAGVYVTYEDYDIGGEARSLQMLEGSHMYKTREAGRYDGSNRIDRPW